MLRRAATRKGLPYTDAQAALPFEERFEKDLRYVVEQIGKIEHMPSDNADAVREKELILKEKVDHEREKYRHLANLWCAFWFLEPVAREKKPAAPLGSGDYLVLRDSIKEGTEGAAERQLRPRLKRVEEIARDRHFFHWELEFPEVFFDGTGRPLEDPGFDAVIGNPPYQFGENIPGDVRRVASWFDLAIGQYDTYWLFYEQVIRRWLADGGYHGFIVPDAVLARDETARLRNMLCRQFRLVALAHVGAVFEDPNVSAATVVWQKAPVQKTLVSIGVRQGESVAHTDAWHQDEFDSLPGQRWLVHLGRQGFDLVKRLFGVSSSLGEHLAVSRGEELGRDDLHSDDARNREPILVGEDVSPLGFVAPSRFVESEKVAKGRTNYGAPKIVLVKTGDTLVATLDAVGYVTLQSLYNLSNKESGLHLEYVAAVLKARIATWVLQKTFTEYKQMFPQLNQTTVEELAVRRVNFTTPKGQRQRLVREGKTLCDKWGAAGVGAPALLVGAGSYGGFVDSPVGRWLGKRLPNKADGSPNFDGEQSDVVHDVLAHLAEQMMEMNKKKRAEVKRFLEWLEQEIRSKVDGLRQKTKIQEYHEGDFAVILDALKANDAAIGGIAHKSFFQENLRREFEKSTKVVAPLKARIAATDRLIDLIVYRVYNLSPEDVGVVEGAAVGA